MEFPTWPHPYRAPQPTGDFAESMRVSECKEVGSWKWLPTNWDTLYAKYLPEGENWQATINALPSVEIAFGFQRLVVNILNIKKPLHQKTHRPPHHHSWEIMKRSSLERYRTVQCLNSASIETIRYIPDCDCRTIPVSVVKQCRCRVLQARCSFSINERNASIVKHLCILVLACKKLVLDLLPIRALIEIGFRESRLCCRPVVYLICSLFQPLVRVWYLFAFGCTLIYIDMVGMINRGITIRNLCCKSHCRPKSVSKRGFVCSGNRG